ncbi:MAG: acyl carrier protein [Candidatus Omnitrophica bacterium]|nr:acyl carrier protein [Candidatus Omnitrophota bacterium]MCM8816068.1 acyl carrier protein [Candidatus Omnitrophota bacterium]
MERAEIEKKVKEVVSRILGVDESIITPESRFVEDLGAESVQSLELVAAFEEAFDIEMEEQAALEVKTVGKAVDFISKYLK